MFALQSQLQDLQGSLNVAKAQAATGPLSGTPISNSKAETYLPEDQDDEPAGADAQPDASALSETLQAKVREGHACDRRAVCTFVKRC